MVPGCATCYLADDDLEILKYLVYRLVSYFGHLGVRDLK